MARLSLILVLLTLTVNSFSQTVSRDAIASGGNSVTISGYTISSIFGQIPFQTLSDKSYYLTQGFEQPRIRFATNPNDSIQVFPNPVSDYLNLVFTLSVQKNFIISIFNLTGTEVQTFLAPDMQNGVLYTIDFTKMPNGMYLIHIYDNSAEKKLYKVIKIEKFSKPQ
jgi:Secretion system C-terminal sorting domain